MEKQGPITVIYTLFLGLILTIFVGFGISAFYEPTTSYTYEAGYEAYADSLGVYNLNVAVIALVASVLLLMVGLVLESYIHTISDGFLLGGLFTLIYSVTRGMMANDSRCVFIIAAVGLVVVLYLGYHKFLRTQSLQRKNRKKNNKTKQIN